MPIIDKSRDMGTVVMGKIESGSVRRGDSLIVMPNKVSEEVNTEGVECLCWICFPIFWQRAQRFKSVCLVVGRGEGGHRVPRQR